MTQAVVGTLIAYAGEALDTSSIAALAAEGWLVCDGTTYAQLAYPELDAAIGSTWGTASESFEFVVPDLRSQFLCGSSSSLAVGASQGYTTAAPTAAFTATITPTSGTALYYDEYRCLHALGVTTVELQTMTTTLTSSPGGGDDETMPVHADIVWLICCSSINNGLVSENCVVSSISSLAANTPWQLADGTDAPPDLRGLFLRGSDDGRSTNLSAIPYSTAWPTMSGTASMTVSLADVALASTQHWGHGSSTHQLLRGDQSGSATVAVGGGGDAETRPANVAADLLIATAGSASFEAGMIVAFAGTAAASGNWLACDGSTVPASTWPDLADAIPWALSGSNITLPDLQSQFLRATDRGAGVDDGPRQPAAGPGPDGQGSTETQATGAPSTPWTYPCNLPTTTADKEDAAGSNVPAYRLDGSTPFTVTVTGWDDETCPQSCGVTFWICAST